MTRLRVVMACDWFVRYTAALARGIGEADAEVMLLTRSVVGELPDVQGSGGHAVERYVADVLAGSGQHRTLSGRVRDVGAVPEVFGLRARVKRFEPDVVHVQESVLDDPRLLWVCGVRRGRYAVTFHDPAPHPGDPVPSRRRRASERLLLANAGLIFTHSEVDRDELRRLFKTDAPIEVVPHGTGHADVSEVPSSPSMLFFGRLVAYKGLAVLLDALEQVWEAVPEARLVVAGAGDLPEHPLLADPRVELRHHHIPDEQVPDLFKQARCVVLPYTQASQSGVGSQAKVYGRGMVVTATGGLPELVADGSGLVVPPGDVPALAAGLIECLTAPARAEQLGECAAAGARTSDWPEVGRRTLEAYARHLPTTVGRGRVVV